MALYARIGLEYFRNIFRRDGRFIFARPNFDFAAIRHLEQQNSLCPTPAIVRPRAYARRQSHLSGNGDDYNFAAALFARCRPLYNRFVGWRLPHERRLAAVIRFFASIFETNLPAVHFFARL